ncbi:aminotransferase class V-fold PLP-dependent enzyme [Cytophaga sp. FL35]|uniref:aminotransferase class V-fold PLP-dependent enzyme n=1 Tax=Cytophaga sp. FL35 TaxID=1904456 RepID=UPI0016535A78|nr:aminotransferase class V-fold PLP-dependent enzyme [Cytophaga sp. FL35]MBC6998517.1 aminotransferase class V-fold PLP-dependent enzyme [Cytophaga sp. FL35]
MKQVRKDFPVLQRFIYANTASAGLLSEPLMTWRQEHDLDFLIGGSNFKTRATQELLPQVKETVASFFGSKLENTALVQNFSLALNILLEGLAKNEKVLLVKDDYPSVNWPFESRDFNVDYALLDVNVEDHILKKLKSGSFSVLALSLVQWASGIKIGLPFLREVKMAYPSLLIIVDGTQFCGTADFNFQASPIDVLGASAYKWLISGYGNGFMLFKDGIEERFQLKTLGFYASNADLGGKNNIPFSKHFEPGHLDTLNFGSLKFSLEYLEKIGMKTIESHLNKLCSKTIEGLKEMNLLSAEIKSRNELSTIFNIPGNASYLKKLESKDLVCSHRGNGVRLSFHFYNTEEDVEETLKILQSTS